MPKESIPGSPGFYRDWVFTIRRTAGLIVAEIVVHVFADGGRKMQSFRIPADDFPGLPGIKARVDVKLDAEDWTELTKPLNNTPSSPLGQ